MQEIVQTGTKVLRAIAAEVPNADIGSARLNAILADMKEALDAEPDGAALAAPQIGVSLRIFIISERVFGATSEHEEASKDPHFVFINPKIVKRSRKKEQMDEGCLSVRGKYGHVVRATNITVEALDESGKLFRRGAGGLLAQAFQHEIDHLDGTLFIDKATELWDVEVPEKNTA